jgi:YVTN family beta-propeller protein
MSLIKIGKNVILRRPRSGRLEGRSDEPRRSAIAAITAANVANGFSNTVSAIATSSNTVAATVTIGNSPLALGVFIQPAMRFAGTPRFSNCHGQSIATLTQKYGEMTAADAALGFASVPALQTAIHKFCRV